MNHKKSRLTDLFRKMDKDNNGLIPRGEFIDGILNTSMYYVIYTKVIDIIIKLNYRIRYITYGNGCCC